VGLRERRGKSSEGRVKCWRKMRREAEGKRIGVKSINRWREEREKQRVLKLIFEYKENRKKTFEKISNGSLKSYRNIEENSVK